MFKMSRRGFLVGCSAAIATMTGGLSFTAFGSAEEEPNQEIIIAVFLRGGIDGINIVPPIAGEDRGYYQAKRPHLAVPVTGTNAALALDHASACTRLRPRSMTCTSQKLAIVHAAGFTSDTRSHFDAMQYMELGTPGSKSSTTGWLTRHLHTAGNIPPEIILPALAVGNLQPAALLGSRESIGMTGPSDFNFGGHWYYGDWQRQALRVMYNNGGTWLHQAGMQTLDAIDVVEAADAGELHAGQWRRLSGRLWRQHEDGGPDDQDAAWAARGDSGPGRLGHPRISGRRRRGLLCRASGRVGAGLAAFFADLSNHNGVTIRSASPLWS